jgi:hypothetical protein
MARPSLYSSELVETICEQLAKGQALAAICRGRGMPSVRTFLQWADEQDGVAVEYTRALAARGEWFAAEHDRIRKTAKDRDSAAVARVQLSALEWQMSKMAPKRYGDATVLKHANADGEPVARLTGSAIAIRLASIFDQIGRREEQRLLNHE